MKNKIIKISDFLERKKYKSNRDGSLSKIDSFDVGEMPFYLSKDELKTLFTIVQQQNKGLRRLLTKWKINRNEMQESVFKIGEKAFIEKYGFTIKQYTTPNLKIFGREELYKQKPIKMMIGTLIMLEIVNKSINHVFATKDPYPEEVEKWLTIYSTYLHLFLNDIFFKAIVFQPNYGEDMIKNKLDSLLADKWVQEIIFASIGSFRDITEYAMNGDIQSLKEHQIGISRTLKFDFFVKRLNEIFERNKEDFNQKTKQFKVIKKDET